MSINIEEKNYLAEREVLINGKSVNDYKLKPLSELIADVYYDAYVQIMDINKSSPFRHFILKGGRQSSKGTFAYMVMAFRLLREPNSQVFVYVPQQAAIGDGAYEQVQEVLQLIGLTEDDYKLNKSPYSIELKNGSKFSFKGLDAGNSKKSDDLFKGVSSTKNIVGCVFDELAGLMDNRRLNVIVKTLSRRPDCKFIYVFNPPDDLTHWLFDFSDKAIDRHNYYVLHTTIFDLPKHWFTEEQWREIEDDKELSFNDYCQEWLGMATAMNTVAFPIRQEKLLTNIGNVNDYHTWFIVCDNGNLDATTFTLFGIRYGGQLVAVQNYYHSGRASNEVVAQSTYAHIMKNFLDHVGHGTFINVDEIYTDDLNFVMELDKVGIDGVSIEKVKGKSRSQCYTKTWDLMQRGLFKVAKHQSNKMLIDQIKYAQKDYDNQGRRVVAKVDNNTTEEKRQIHALDTVLYAILLKYNIITDESEGNL